MSTIQNILKDSRAHMEKALEAAKHEFTTVRSGKALSLIHISEPTRPY